MKHLIILLMLLIPTVAFADKDVYLKGNVGIFMMDDMDITYNGKDYDGFGYGNIGSMESDAGLSFSIAIGKRFKSGFNVELEYANKNADVVKFKGNPLAIDHVCGCDVSTDVLLTPDDINLNGNIEIETLMVNVIYDFKNSTIWTPYLGVGFGAVKMTPEEFFYAAETENFGYQLLVGVDAAIGDFSVLAGYRYLSAGALSRHNTIETEADNYWGESKSAIDIHGFEFGVKYNFL